MLMTPGEAVRPDPAPATPVDRRKRLENRLVHLVAALPPALADAYLDLLEAEIRGRDLEEPANRLRAVCAELGDADGFAESLIDQCRERRRKRQLAEA